MRISEHFHKGRSVLVLYAHFVLMIVRRYCTSLSVVVVMLVQASEAVILCPS